MCYPPPRKSPQVDVAYGTVVGSGFAGSFGVPLSVGADGTTGGSAKTLPSVVDVVAEPESLVCVVVSVEPVVVDVADDDPSVDVIGSVAVESVVVAEGSVVVSDVVVEAEPSVGTTGATSSKPLRRAMAIQSKVALEVPPFISRTVKP